MEGHLFRKNHCAIPEEKIVEQLIKQQLENWRKLLHETERLISSGIPRESLPPEKKIHLLLQEWVGYGEMPGRKNKEEMITLLKENPKIKEEVERFTQTVIRHKYGKEIETITLFKGVYGKKTLTEVSLHGWDSLTANREFAENVIAHSTKFKRDPILRKLPVSGHTIPTM
jgi:hypothetical protein